MTDLGKWADALLDAEAACSAIPPITDTEPVYGWLTDVMASASEAPLALDAMIHPRVEPEIAFVLGFDLSGSGVTIHECSTPPWVRARAV